MQIKPMLAVNTSIPAVRFPCYASAKLDGIRGLVIDGQLRSRSLKPIPNEHTTKLYSRADMTGFDGELIVGSPTAKDVCRVSTGAMARAAFAPKVCFYVFDDFTDPTLEFQHRNAKLIERITASDELLAMVRDGSLVILPQMLVNNATQLREFEETVLAVGYEGLILRSPHGRYKCGRSTEAEGGMLKLKRFTDSEAEIIAVVEECANENEATTNELGRTHRSTAKAGLRGKGRAGALTVRDVHSGVEFNIGGGFDDRDRDWFWQHREQVAGRIVKYKSFLIGVKEAPRFPIYLGGREAWDMSAA